MCLLVDRIEEASPQLGLDLVIDYYLCWTSTLMWSFGSRGEPLRIAWLLANRANEDRDWIRSVYTRRCGTASKATC